MESNESNVEFNPEVGHKPDVSKLPIDYPEPIENKTGSCIRLYPKVEDDSLDDSDFKTENYWLADFYEGEYKDTTKEVPKDKVRNLPYQTIVKVTSNFKDKTLIGTAVLVGPNHALTSYSNIHKKKLGDAISVEVSSHIQSETAKMKNKLTFGLDEPDTLGLKYYKNTDIALLILDKKIGIDLGYLPMISLEDYVNKKVFLVGTIFSEGYPVIQGDNQGKVIKSERAIQEGLLIYDMRAHYKSLVGSPIYVIEDKKAKIIAIQSYKELKGTLLTKERIAIFAEKIKETTIKSQTR